MAKPLQTLFLGIDDAPLDPVPDPEALADNGAVTSVTTTGCWALAGNCFRKTLGRPLWSPCTAASGGGRSDGLFGHPRGILESRLCSGAGVMLSSSSFDDGESEVLRLMA
jgi:hypothetical protein